MPPHARAGGDGRGHRFAAYPRCSADTWVRRAEMLTNWLGGMRSGWRALWVPMVASNRFGRAAKLRRTGRKREALEVARLGLVMLRAPSSHRCHGPLSVSAHCTQAMLTLQVEQLADELGTSGAEPADLVHVAWFLRSLPPETGGSAALLKNQWLPYLEDRLTRLTGGHVGATTT